MHVVIGDREEEVFPTPEWVRRTLHEVDASIEGSRFLAVLRGGEDQLNVLREPDGFALEWYLGDPTGPHVAYRKGEGADHQPRRRRSFLESIFRGPETALGSRFSLEEIAAVLDAYVGGAADFPDLRWERLYR